MVILTTKQLSAISNRLQDGTHQHSKRIHLTTEFAQQA
jgi:hypothetical protein